MTGPGRAGIMLAAEDIACVRGGRELFRGLRLAASGGDLIALRGVNGAGKSSLLRLLAGLLRPTAGSIALEGGDSEQELAEQAHYVGHYDAIKPALTVAENLGFWVDMLGGAEPGAISGGLDALGIGALADFPAAILSAGQRRRLALSRLVAVGRPVWLLDEPTTALDDEGQARLYRLISEHRANGGLAIVATHSSLPDATDTLTLGAHA